MKRNILILFAVLLIFKLSAFSQTQTVYFASDTLDVSDKVIKNAPFSAESINESIQMLADGNKIKHSTVTRLYRDKDGRLRREGIPSSGVFLGTVVSLPPVIYISDPISKMRYVLNTKTKIARQSPWYTFTISGNFKLNPPSGPLMTLGTQSIKERARVESAGQVSSQNAKKIQEESKIIEASAKYTSQAVKKTHEEVRAAKTYGVVTQTYSTSGGSMAIALPRTGNFVLANEAFSTTTKDMPLGTRNIEGVNAEGTRTITTIPAGTIGNERAIEIVYERWYSKDLQQIVLSKHDDPRFGEQTYRLVKINRNEPSASLFSLPSDYKITAEGYRTPKAQ